MTYLQLSGYTVSSPITDFYHSDDNIYPNND